PGVGGVRLLRFAFALLLGPAPAPGMHPWRTAGRVRADRRESRRTANPARHPDRRTRLGRRPARTDADRRQELLRQGLRTHAERSRYRPAPPSPQRRALTPRGPAVQAPPPDHRVDQPNLQRTTHLERRGGHTPAGVIVRVLQRILALPPGRVRRLGPRVRPPRRRTPAGVPPVRRQRDGLGATAARRLRGPRTLAPPR